MVAAAVLLLRHHDPALVICVVSTEVGDQQDEAAREEADSLPLGSGAIAGTSYEIDVTAMAPEPPTKERANLRSKSLASCSGVRREISSRVSSRWRPVS